jgi:large subunit ribosomal protein L37Ae
MAKRTKKVKSAGRFRAGYGKRVRERITDIEKKQRKKQKCPFCSKHALKRLSKGIWLCKKCNKKFASNTYYMD